MGFKSINEVEKFSFEDCQINSIKVEESCVEFNVEALIIKSNNSQNTNCTDSYAGTTRIRLQGGKILSGILDGFKYYDANGVLQTEIPDNNLSMEEILATLKESSGAYLYDMKLVKQEDENYYYSIGIEFESEEAYDTTPAKSYEINVVCTQLAVSWEIYMNRVQRG
jgi:hypothetical protein